MSISAISPTSSTDTATAWQNLYLQSLAQKDSLSNPAAGAGSGSPLLQQLLQTLMQAGGAPAGAQSGTPDAMGLPGADPTSSTGASQPGSIGQLLQQLMQALAPIVQLLGAMQPNNGAGNVGNQLGAPQSGGQPDGTTQPAEQPAPRHRHHPHQPKSEDPVLSGLTSLFSSTASLFSSTSSLAGALGIPGGGLGIPAGPSTAGPTQSPQAEDAPD